MKRIMMILIVGCALLVVGCSRGGSPLLRIREQVYDSGSGWKTCGDLVVRKDRSYAYVVELPWDPSPAKFTYTGFVPDSLFFALQKSVSESDRFTPSDGIPTYSLGIDNTKTRHPDSVLKVIDFVHSAKKKTSSGGKK